MHETVKVPASPLRPGSLALLFALIVLGGTADAAGIGLNLRGMRTTFRKRLQGDAIRALAWEQASECRRGCIETPAVSRST